MEGVFPPRRQGRHGLLRNLDEKIIHFAKKNQKKSMHILQNVTLKSVFFYWKIVSVCVQAFKNHSSLNKMGERI